MAAAPQEHRPKDKADIGVHAQAADSDLVTDVFTAMPLGFFVVGGPRNGTKALSKALVGIPNASFSKSKQTHFLRERRSGLPDDTIRRAHLGLFHPKLSRQTQAIGDGSLSYRCNTDAVRQALIFDDRDRFIASVKHLVEILRSRHAGRLFSLGGSRRSVREQPLAFPGVDDDGRTTLKPKRETSVFESRWLPQVVMSPPSLAFRLVEMIGVKTLCRFKVPRKRSLRCNKARERRQKLSGACVCCCVGVSRTICRSFPTRWTEIKHAGRI